MKFIIAISSILIILISGCALNTNIPGRAPNQFEIAYLDISENLQDSDICYKIYSKAYLTASFSTKGYQVSYLQSECLFNLASKTNNPYFCNDVKSISTTFLDGSKISKENCIKKANEQNKGNSQIAYNINASLILPKMGYTEDMWSKNVRDRHEESISLGLNPLQAKEEAWYGYYLEVLFTNDFKNRLDKLPTFTE